MIQQNRTETEEYCNYSLGLSVGFFRNPNWGNMLLSLITLDKSIPNGVKVQ